MKLRIPYTRWLHIPLYDAERAWAYAMELKHATDGPTTRMRFHLLKRLQKAAKLADKFAVLCTQRADDQTSLEAEVSIPEHSVKKMAWSSSLS